MSDEKRATERDRREEARAAADRGLEADAHRVPGREIKQMVSVRFEPALIAALRRVAEERDMAVSDLLREAAARIVEDARRPRMRLEIHSRGEWPAVAGTHLNFTYWNGTDVQYTDVAAAS